MKCVCGYTYRVEEVDGYEDGEVIEGDVPFYEAAFTISFNTKRYKYDADYYEAEVIYICPKCGTLKVNL